MLPTDETDLAPPAAALPAAAVSVGTFANSYAALPAQFHVRLPPARVPEPRLVKLNRDLAAELGLVLDGLDDGALAALFAGNTLAAGMDPIALAYAGHQFGNFVPQLGDGRAILLGEVVDRAGRRRDIQLKGSGRTPFSRSGDGRAALGPVLREYLVSEAMHALGIPTTRTLAAVTTGQPVFREGPLPGAVLTRVASSHVRVGTFQFFAARGDDPSVQLLADYVIDRHYPEARTATRPYLALYEAIIDRQASLVARWLLVGFIHGVMNTDNMTLSGETIDFGPCAFMDAYDPATVFSSIDRFGRYAYANQPNAARWNLARFGETILPLIDPVPEQAVELANAAIAGFTRGFDAVFLDGMRAKLGLGLAEDGDLALVQSLLEAMHKGGADFTLTFRRLGDDAAHGVSEPSQSRARALFADPAAFDAFTLAWHARLARETTSPAERAAAMRAVNPAVIPRNHRVEQALDAAVERGDFLPFENLLEAVTHPFDETESAAPYRSPPQPEERVLATFCGT